MKLPFMAAANKSSFAGPFLCIGFFFGRTPLIKLSPKKTWEGFIGGFIGTVISAFYLAKVFIHFKWMTCPRLVSGSARCIVVELLSGLACV